MPTIEWLSEFGSWCWHLFVLPPDEALPWPAWLKALLKPPLERLAMRLAVPNPRSLRSWVMSVLLAHAPSGAWSDPEREPLAPLRRPLSLPRRLQRALLVRLVPARVRAALRLRRYGRTLAALYPRQTRATRLLLALLAAVVVVLFATTPLEDPQLLLLLATLWLASVLARLLPGQTTALLLVAISMLATSRYAWWRLTSTLAPGVGIEWWLSLGLIAAESYTWLILFLGYLQNAQPLGRRRAPLPAERASWPSVDVFIPTINEPLAVVRPTVLAALGLDWPGDKLTVWLLDDGDRAEFRSFAAAAGARYLARETHGGAKAGNLNYALARSSAQCIAIFDCDHLPVRSFLTETVGWFGADPQCALVQTPHHFFSADPFERNLGTFGRVPSEGRLFYGLVQDGNDFWNASYFCGSCAVLRRAPLLAIGGIATDSVTEDAHTALRLHRHGYSSAYLRRILAAGLATESLSSHIRQRVRWARGMAQIFRIDNPLTGRGLTLPQRLCYLNAMLHFFSGLPRLVFLTAPLAYLFFEFHVINAAAATLALYALPHLMQAAIANSYLQRRFRHSLWNEAYEVVLSWYIALPTLAALLNPRRGGFRVTAKGGTVEREYFDWRISLPYLSLVLVNLAGALIAVPRMLYWNSFEADTVFINLLWTLFNLTLLGAALGVATETRQVRGAARVERELPVRVHYADGSVAAGYTLDFSMTGVRITLPADVAPATAPPAAIGLDAGAGEQRFPVEEIRAGPGPVGLRLLPMSLADQQRYVQCTFARADAWSHWNAGIAPDRPLASVAEVFAYGVSGYLRLLRVLSSALAARLPGALRRRAAATR